VNRQQALAAIANLHIEWSLRHGDKVPNVAADANPHPGSRSDLSVWQADRSAPSEIDDPLNIQIVAILAQVDEGAPANRLPAHGLPVNISSADVDLSKVQRDWERQLDQLLAQWFTVTAKQRDQILDHVRSAINNNDLAALAALNVSSAEQANILTAAMTTMALNAAQHVTDEAARQGVRVDPVATDTNRFAATAVALSVLLTAALTNSAGREALRRWSPSTSGDDVARAVGEHLASLSTAFVEAHLGGALTAAQNTGRLETMLASPTAALYASEQMDSNTCSPCSKINGKWIGNTDDPDIVAKVEAIYPNGGYVHCLGGVRCRGAVVSVHRPEQVNPAAP
jgi:hypothetical protein